MGDFADFGNFAVFENIYILARFELNLARLDLNLGWST
jgi:hypothetical protein